MSLWKRVDDARAGELGLELWVVSGEGDLRDQAHARLRSLLAHRLALGPDELVFVREPCPLCGELHGRPALGGPDPRVHFSIARRPGVALIGIAAAPVGVDIEAVPHASAADEVAAVKRG